MGNVMAMLDGHSWQPLMTTCKRDADAGWDTIWKMMYVAAFGPEIGQCFQQTVPMQLLNSHGEAAYNKMSDVACWKNMVMPQNSAVAFMTEMSSLDNDRRGVGINRALSALVDYCKRQNKEEIKWRNQHILTDKIFTGLYAEIDTVLPSLLYICAPKKPKQSKASASSLRFKQGASHAQPAQDSVKLDKCGKIVYDWLDTEILSYIRLLLQWQSGGGSSHVSASHHRSLQCFRYQGNSHHEGVSQTEITLKEWQRAIAKLHAGLMEEDYYGFTQADYRVNKKE
jgi:hypothetical protein